MGIFSTVYDVKLSDISGIKKENIRKTKLMSLQETVKTRTSDTCIKEYMNSRGIQT
jgi:hypothetical protein